MERKSTFPLGFAAFAVGLNIANLLHLIADDTDQKVKEVQTYNTQVKEQLQAGYSDIRDLAIELDGKTYGFVTSSSGQTERCEGTYKVENERAVAVGHVACTVMKPLGATVPAR